MAISKPHLELLTWFKEPHTKKETLDTWNPTQDEKDRLSSDALAKQINFHTNYPNSETSYLVNHAGPGKEGLYQARTSRQVGLLQWVGPDGGQTQQSFFQMAHGFYNYRAIESRLITLHAISYMHTFDLVEDHNKELINASNIRDEIEKTKLVLKYLIDYLTAIQTSDILLANIKGKVQLGQLPDTVTREIKHLADYWMNKTMNRPTSLDDLDTWVAQTQEKYLKETT